MYYNKSSDIIYQHDWRMLLLAGLVCLGTAHTFVLMHNRLQNTLRSTLRSTLRKWLPLAALLGGLAIWVPQVLGLRPAVLTHGLIVFAAVLTLYLGGRDRRMRENVIKARSLADASIEGLVIQGRNGVLANRRFREMTGLDDRQFREAPLDQLFSPPDTLANLARNGGPLESELVCCSGNIPVEVSMSDIDFGGAPARAISIRDLRKQRAAEDRIHFLANNDPLTGLPNRRYLYRKFREILHPTDGDPQPAAVLCFDLDRLKQVNDLLGHFTGDKMLKRFAEILSQCVGEHGVAARLGGDEFAVILPGISGQECAEDLARAIIAALDDENRAAGHEFELSTSIGLAIAPRDGADKQALLTAADIALYRAKADQRGTFCVFESEMGRELIERRQLERDVQMAVSRHELSIVYQPQIDARTGAATGYEALVRWTRPGLGEISPTQFIPLAEKCGAIFGIGEWVLERACADAAGWDAPLMIAVNVSPLQICSSGFVAKVHETLLAAGISPRRLELEVTETALIHDFDRALLTLRQLKHLGISIVMDDFGTGYSSLANLRAFPFDKIKIDRSFVAQVHKNEKSATIVRAVLGIGKGLGVPVLAEGVETSEELAFLQAAECDEVQGFFIGIPTPAAANASSRPEMIARLPVEPSALAAASARS